MASIKHLFHIASQQQQVFDAIATIPGLQSWWTTDLTGSSETGGILAFRFNGMGPDFKVTGKSGDNSVSWECVNGFPDWIGTTITFHLDQNEGKTRIRFEHAGWQETGDHYAACCFSWGRYLESLRQYCQAGTGAPFGAK